MMRRHTKDAGAEPAGLPAWAATGLPEETWNRPSRPDSLTHGIKLGQLD